MKPGGLKKKFGRLALVCLSLCLPLLLAELVVRMEGVPSITFYQVAADGSRLEDLVARTDFGEATRLLLVFPDGLKEKVTYTDSDGAGFYRPDMHLGWGLGVDRAVRMVVLEKGQVLYDVVHTLGSKGGRVAQPVSEPHGTLSFFGGSFCFGSGVDDNDTLPSLCGQLLSWRSENYGVPGYGTHQVVRQLSVLSPNDVGPKPRHFVYVFIPEHVQRAVGAFPNSSHGIGPYYQLGEPAGGVRLVGSFAKGKPLATWVFKLLSHSLLARRYLAWPSGTSEAELELTAALVKECQELSRERFDADFSIVFYPELEGRPYPDGVLESLKAKLEDKGVRVFHYPQGASWPPEFRIEGDAHPTPAAHARLSTFLAEGLRPHLPDSPR